MFLRLGLHIVSCFHYDITQATTALHEVRSRHCPRQEFHMTHSFPCRPYLARFLRRARAASDGAAGKEGARRCRHRLGDQNGRRVGSSHGFRDACH